MTSELFAKMRDLSGARINLTGYVIEAINDFIIEPELKLPLENASVNSLKLYTAEQWLVSALLGLNLARQLQGITSITARTSMANGVKDSVDNNAPQPPSVAKPYLSFSIENILSSGTFGPREQSRKENAQRGESSEKAGDAGKHPVQTLFTRLPWLAYTRYCPPKIPSEYYIFYLIGEIGIFLTATFIYFFLPFFFHLLSSYVLLICFTTTCSFSVVAL